MADALSQIPPVSASTLERWMADRIGEALSVSPDELDVHAPFSEHGLDSVAALQLTGELETLLGKQLSATLVYEYPTIATLSEHLGG
jgi:acyl carrier protein